jgi:hypothetical protein
MFDSALAQQYCASWGERALIFLIHCDGGRSVVTSAPSSASISCMRLRSIDIDIASGLDTEQRSYFFQLPACTHMPQRLLMLSCCFVEER